MGFRFHGNDRAFQLFTMPKITITFLGTNGWYSTETGNTTCVLIDTDEYAIICDAGNGLRLLDQHLKNFDKPVYLFLSHFHMDHITGLHLLAKYRFIQGLEIVCYRGGWAILDQIICQPYTIAFKDLPFITNCIQLNTGRHDRFPFGLVCEELVHSSRCYGYRFEINSKVITFCTDTGCCDAVLKLGKDADVLITECALKSGQTNPEWPHLNPEIAAQMAKDAGAKQLVLMHFDAHVYQTLNDRQEAEGDAKKVFPQTTAATDGMIIRL